jgi:glutamate racemase
MWIAFWMAGRVDAQQSSAVALDQLIAHAPESPSVAAWTFDPSDFQQDLRQLPIGVFDSGIGGLTVLEAILALDAYKNDTLQPGADGRKDFEGESFVYLGDQANMPYGNYPAADQVDYLRELILKDAIFLLGRRYWPATNSTEPVFDKRPVKAIAIGCNTATAYGLTDVSSALKTWNLPVFAIGVVQAGARGVVQLPDAATGHESSIAVLATVGTCRSEAYPRAIQQLLGQAGRRHPTILQQGFVDLAAAIEGDPQVLARNSVQQIVHRDIREMVESHKQSGRGQPISTVILGCTHFPLVKEQIISTLRDLRELKQDGQHPYQSLIAETIHVVDPAEWTARELFRSLALARLRAKSTDQPSESEASIEFFISAPNPRCPSVQLGPDAGLDPSYKVARQPGQLTVEDTIVVPLQLDQIPDGSLNLIRHQLPHVWSGMKRQNGQ